MKQSIFCLFLSLLGLLKQTVRLHMQPPILHRPLLHSLYWISSLYHSSLSSLCLIHWLSFLPLQCGCLCQPYSRWLCKWSAGRVQALIQRWRIKKCRDEKLRKEGKQQREGYRLVHSPRQRPVKFWLHIHANLSIEEMERSGKIERCVCVCQGIILSVILLRILRLIHICGTHLQYIHLVPPCNSWLSDVMSSKQTKQSCLVWMTFLQSCGINVLWWYLVLM